MRYDLISKIADVQTGPFGSQLHKEDYVSFGTPIVTVEHLGNRTFTEQNLPRVSDADKARLSKYILKEGDIVFSRVGSVDRCSYVDKLHDGWMFSGRCLRVRPYDMVDSLFLYYFFCLERTKEHIRNIAVGATMPSINTKLLGEIEIPLTQLEIQKKIAAILSALDDKIELNQRINNNMQQLARMLFRQWMLENEENYTITSLEEIAKINPDTYSPKEAWAYINYLDTSNITKGIISEIQYIPATEKIPSRARRKVLPNDIVYSTVRPNQHHYGIIASPLENMLVSTGFAVIRSKTPSICNELIYLTITENEAVEKLQQIAEQSTSTFPAIKPSDVGSCLIPCPIKNAAFELTKQLKAIYFFIAANNKQNKSLASIRDTILPKLMSGEIDVSAVQF